jgi:D-alanine-D-alanine ligase
MSNPRANVLLLYGIDTQSQRFEVESTLHLVNEATAALGEQGWRVMPLQLSDDIVAPLAPYKPDEWVVLNLCEGALNQSFYYAKVADTLGRLGYTFTGSDSWSLDETQYKWRMKVLLERAGVPTPPWSLCRNPAALTFEHYPAIVKPAHEHCSYGITRDSVVTSIDEARVQCGRCIDEFNQPALIEQFLDSAEYNVSVWGSAEHPAGFEVLGISTMTYDYFEDIHDRLCTFEAKWTPESLAYQKIPAICPAPVTPELKLMLENVAIAAYRASHVRDYGRIDIRLDGAGRPMVLDVNSNCDVSREGGFMNAARAKGLSYGQMLERIVELALVRGANNRNAGDSPSSIETPDQNSAATRELVRP